MKPKSRKNGGHKPAKTAKVHPQKLRDFLLIKGKIYYVESQSDRDKLLGYESSNKPCSKDSVLPESVMTHQYSGPQQPKVPRPPRTKPSKTLEERIRLLTVEKRQIVMAELQKDVESTEASSCMDLLEQELRDVQLTIQSKHNQYLELLEECRLRISQTEYNDKESIVRRIKDRKMRVLENMRGIFQQVLVKERELTEGELNLSQVLYSAEVVASSVERIADQEELKQDKVRLIKHLQSKLNLKLDLTAKIVHSEPSGGSSENRFEASMSPIEKKHESPKKQDETLDLKCEEHRPKPPMIIPLIMTKDKREQLEKERSVQQQKATEHQIEKRLELQLGQFEPDNQAGLATSLLGMSRYLDALISHIQCKKDVMEGHYLADVLELINMPYGRSVEEALVSMRQNHEEISSTQEQHFILSDKLFVEVEKEFVGASKQSDPQHQLKECEHIHNRAMFDCMNHALNLYRPYYQSNGEVYPWLTTEKGMTFYSISEENIEEVFEKCKIKILETAACLCGVLPSEELNAVSKPLYEQKRQELLKRAIALEINQESDKWTAFETEQATLQLRLSESVLDVLLLEFAQEW